MTHRMITITMATVVAAIAASAPVMAVQIDADATATISAPPADRAETLRQQAESLFSQPRHWGKAARLLEQSAQLRGASDPEAYVCLLHAGRLRAGMGDYEGARTTLEKAARHAAARGALLDAAHAWIDAAHAAIEGQDMARATALAERAQLLAGSPLLSASEVEQITRRISD
jgi:tetratricopeptide (TPR) repeat protein